MKSLVCVDASFILRVLVVEFWRIPLRLSTRRVVLQLAWDLVQTLNRPRAYDTAYLALAQLHAQPELGQ